MNSSSSQSTTAPLPSNVSTPELSPSLTNLHPSSTRIILPPLPIFISILKRRRTPSQKFWFNVYEWLGDKVVDFVFFYLPKDLDFKSRKDFRGLLTTAAGHDILCQSLLIEGDSQTFADRLNEDIKSLGKKGCSDWIELYIGILFLEYHDEFWEVIQRIVLFTLDHWKLDPHVYSRLSNNIESTTSNSLKTTTKPFEQQSTVQSPESNNKSNNKSNVNHSNNQSNNSSFSIEEKTRNKSSRPSSSKIAIRSYSILMLAWIGIDILRDSIKSSPQIVQNCSNILMTLLNELVMEMWRTTNNLQLPSITSKNTETVEQYSNSSYDITVIETFKNKISQYLIDNRFQTKALYNAFLDLASIKIQLDDFRTEIISTINLTKIYNFIFHSSDSVEWKIKRSHREKKFPGESTIMCDNSEQIFEGNFKELAKFLLTCKIWENEEPKKRMKKRKSPEATEGEYVALLIKEKETRNKKIKIERIACR